MPKSIDRPMNMTAKAIDTRLSDPMASAVKPNVQMRPTISVTKQATMSLTDRNAANSRPSTSTMERNSAQPMPSATVPNSSSFSGTCPVRRTVTP
jgi:hypothetical protein